MDTSTSHGKHFHNLPPELLDKVFEHSNPTDLARHRVVCAYWRNIIESMYTTRLEMTNANWEAYVKKSTASKIHLKLNSVQYPIYQVPEFIDFVSRVTNLEFTGIISEDNVINILKRCGKIQSLSIGHVRVDGIPRRPDVNNNTDDLVRDLTQLNIGNVENVPALSTVTNQVAAMLKLNCLKELNLSSNFDITDVLRLLFPRVLKELAPTTLRFGSRDATKAIEQILDKQRQSLQLINFGYVHGIPQRATHQFFIKLHPYAEASGSANSANGIENPQICQLQLQDFILIPDINAMLLKIFETQFRMKYLDIAYTNQADLDQIQNIINNNCQTLEKVRIRSTEPAEDTFRLLSCSHFAKCLKLKKLTLRSGNRNRKVKLVDLLHLPTSMEKLFLTGFVPTGSAELFGVPGMSKYPNLAKVSLDEVPWFIQDENPVEVFETTHLRWLLNLFSGIRTLILSVNWIRQSNSIPEIPASFSPEFMSWCRQGGGDNIKIDSCVTCSGGISSQNVTTLHNFTAYICIGTFPH